MLVDHYLRVGVIRWIQERLTPDQFFFFSSMMVGLTAGLAAVALKLFVFYLSMAITYNYDLRFENYVYLAFPAIGIFLTVWLVKKFLEGKLIRGNASVVYSIAKKSSILPGHQMYAHLITSGLTVGLGGSAGLESPIAGTGAAIGSNFGRVYMLGYRERTLLLAAGAAGGIAGAFNAPIAGVLFATEVLLADVTIAAFIPLLVAAASGALISIICLREGAILHFENIHPFDYSNVPYYIIFGGFAGLFSVYYSRTFPVVERMISHLKVSAYTRVAIGGILLALLIFLFPPLFGEGYSSVNNLANGNPKLLMDKGLFAGYSEYPWAILGFLTLVMLLKVFASAITLGSGGNGGNFAPSLFVGAYLGASFVVLSHLLGLGNLPFNNFMLVGMCGVLTGVFHSPLTGIFLIAEISGGYALMIPLMLVSAISYTVTKYFEPFSMDMKALAQRGDILNPDKDKSLLEQLKTHKLVEKNFQALTPNMTLGDLVEIVSRSKRNLFPVVAANGSLTGIVLLDNIREVMFKQELYDQLTVRHLLTTPPAAISSDENMASVMKKFDETGAWNLPVLENGKFIGFISKSSVFSEYRSQLMEKQ